MSATTAPPVSLAAPTTVRRRAFLQACARWALPLLLVLVIAIAAATTPHFLSFDNIRAILINTSIVGIVAVGMTPVTLSGNFFSLGASQSTVLATMVFLALAAAGTPVIIAGAVTVLALVVVGMLQAAVVAEGLNPVVTTLATGSIIYGAVTFFTGGKVVTAHNANIDWIATGQFLGLPTPIYIFFVFTAFVWLLIDRTLYGRQLTLVGANREAAKVSGISIRLTTMWAFIAMSCGMAVAGIVSAAQLGQATANDLPTLTVDTVAAVLVGGTAISGGEGSPVRSAIGALIIVTLSNAMLLHGLPTGLRNLGVGLLVIAVVCALHVIRKVVAR